MSYPSIVLTQSIVLQLRHAGVQQVVLSPGSRNAPLMAGFSQDHEFQCFSLVDERSAAFFALGLIQASKAPVAIVCTSGSAMLNYFPAVSEAYYSDLPLIVISADRPRHLIDIGDGQTIQQEGVYGNHIVHSFNCLEGEEHLLVNQEAILVLLTKCVQEQGPVHLNVPLAEPLYDLVEAPYRLPASLAQPIPQRELPALDLNRLEQGWQKAQRILILVGVMEPNALEADLLDDLLEDPRVLLMSETTSNLHHHKAIWGIDHLITGLNPEQRAALRPDLLITLGGMIVSKRIKAFLRKYQPEEHLHIDPKKAYDTYFCLTQHIQAEPRVVFRTINKAPGKGQYQETWLALRDLRYQRQQDCMRSIPYSDLYVYQTLLNQLPKDRVLQLANSTAIRYTQLFPIDSSLKVYCNRGTSGIDGSTSTAVGHAVNAAQPTVLITGDLSFFYDSNALWNDHVPVDFRIILVNNSGGGIFRILPGARKMEHFETFFETKHGRNARQLVESFGWEYRAASNPEELQKGLDGFFQGPTPALLEVFTPSEQNDSALMDYFKKLL